MIRLANLTGVEDTDRAQVYMDEAARRSGMYETGVKICNKLTGQWLKINVTQTPDAEGARWQFIHLLERLQEQGWKLDTGRDFFGELTQGYGDYLDQAISSWTKVGRG